MVEKTKGRKEEVVTREYTINLHKRLHGWYYIFPTFRDLFLYLIIRAFGSSVLHLVVVFVVSI